MPGIAREQENRTDLINWFISINGVLTDAFSVEYRIFDITGGLPGTQVFPLPAPTYEDVTAAPGHFSTGSYYAYDNTGGVGWTPGVAEAIGTHRIEWRWKATASSPFQAGFEDFEVLPSSVGSSADLYCSVADIRAEGLDAGVADDATVLASIELWQQFLERACRQWFNPRILVLGFDGTDSDTLHFGVPIIAIEYLRINDDVNNLDTNTYRVYSGRSYPDDRRNPRIKLRSLADFPDIYTSPIIAHDLKFIKGRQNQQIKGTFGFVEDDGTTPKLIRRALCKLVIEKLQAPLYSAPGGAPPLLPPPILAGALLEEVTDGHKRKYSDAQQYSERRPSPYQGLTADQEILDIIKLYRAPIGIATPAHPSHTDGSLA